MSLSLIYWITMLIWAIFGVVLSWPANSQGWRSIGGNVLLFLLFLILGWKEFGAPVHT